MVARRHLAQRCLGEIFGMSPYEGGQRVSLTMLEGLLLSFLAS